MYFETQFRPINPWLVQTAATPVGEAPVEKPEPRHFYGTIGGYNSSREDTREAIEKWMATKMRKGYNDGYIYESIASVKAATPPIETKEMVGYKQPKEAAKPAVAPPPCDCCECEDF